MKFIVFSVALIFCIAANAQNGHTVHTFKQIGWTIKLPADFQLMDSMQNVDNMQRGLKAIEDVADVTADLSKTVTLISATKNKFNYFNATIELFDPEDGISWESANQNLKEILYATFAEKMTDAVIDTLSGKEVIDGLSFDKYRVRLTINEKPIFNLVVLSKLYKGYDLGISYLYLDEGTKEQIETMLKQSKFSKK